MPHYFIIRSEVLKLDITHTLEERDMHAELKTENTGLCISNLI
jgi:hypothetical protein